MTTTRDLREIECELLGSITGSAYFIFHKATGECVAAGGPAVIRQLLAAEGYGDADIAGLLSLANGSHRVTFSIYRTGA